MEQPLVSIVVPVYNVEKYVERSIRSILVQTYSNFELILVNDGSKDNSLDICKRLASEDNRIIIIDKDNEGVSKARNDGIDKASGKYIMFIDSDDTMEKNMVHNMVLAAEKNNMDLVMCGYNYNVLENNKIISSIEVLSSEKIIVNNNLIKSYAIEQMLSDLMIHSIWNKLYKREIIKKFNIRYKEGLDFGEDLFFSLDYIYNINSLYVVEECLYNYYQYNNNNNLTSKYRSNKFDIIKIWIRKLDWFSKNISDSKTLDYISWLKTRWILSCCAYVMHGNETHREKRKHIKEILENQQIEVANSSKYIGYTKLILEKILCKKKITLVYLLSLCLFLFKKNFKKVYVKKVTHNVKGRVKK